MTNAGRPATVAVERESGGECWLGTEESNPHIQIQNLLSYH